jgi:hypothetical protein
MGLGAAMGKDQMAKKQKKRRGERLRPCVRCAAQVKFVCGMWTAHGRMKRGWHWENEDGSHHRCGDFTSRRGALDEPSLAVLMGEAMD